MIVPKLNDLSRTKEEGREGNFQAEEALIKRDLSTFFQILRYLSKVFSDVIAFLGAYRRYTYETAAV